MRSLVALAVLILVAPVALAQEADPVVPALAALQEGRTADATRLLERVVEADDENAEAHFHLARIYLAEGPAQDLGRARALVRRAVDLDPDNVIYMAAEIETLRGDSWNFFMEQARAIRRAELAHRIIAIDSTNGYANEELATAAIRDYYQYRNAFWVRDVSFYSPTYSAGDPSDQTEVDPFALDLGAGESDTPDIGVVAPGAPATSPAELNAQGPNQIATRGDRFDREALESYGTISYEERAEKAYRLARHHLEIALASDPRRRGLYDDVMRLAALSAEWREALTPLREMYRHFPEDPEMWLYVGLANHRLGEWEAAAAAFDNALERMPPEALAVFENLEMVLPPEERAAYRESPDTYAASFWTARDPRFLNPFNERRLEHYARLTTADLLYRSSDLDIPGWETERGEVHVRYGVPDEDYIVEGDFGVVLEQYQDRIGTLADPGLIANVNRFNVWDYGDLKFVFEDPNRNGEFVLYAPPADVFSLPSARFAEDMDFVLRAQEAFRSTPERYDFELPGREVDIPARVTSFRGTDGRADVYVHYGVPLAPEAGDDGPVETTIKTGAFLVGEGNQLLAERRKTVYGLRSDQIVPYKAVRLWVGTESLDARPGTHEVAVEFETADGAAAGVHREAIEVPDFNGPGLVLSDLLLATMIEEGVTAGPGRLQRGDFSIQPAPWGVYAVGDPISVYFEAYGLGLEGGQSRYEVEARLVPKDQSRGLGRIVKRIFGGGPKGVSVGFPVEGTGATDGQYILLDATGQEPGVYTLTLRVKDTITGEDAEREADLLLE